MAAPMDEHLIIGLQPEYRIQASPFDVAQRMASTRESFDNKAPGTGLGERASAPLFLDKVPQSAAPVNTNYNGLDIKTQLPSITSGGVGTGPKIQGPNDGPTYLINRAEQVEAAYNAVTINEVNRMLATENYSGAEKLLGRELTTEEVQQRQLGLPSRYTQAQAGVPTGRFPQRVQLLTTKIAMPPNSSNPPKLDGSAESNPDVEFKTTIQANSQSGITQQTREQRNDIFLPSEGQEHPNSTEPYNTRDREEKFVQRLEEEAKRNAANARSHRGQIPLEAQRREEAAVDRQKQYVEQRKQALSQQSGHGIQFGRFMVHGGKLAEGTLSMKYAHSGKKITDLPNKRLHPALQQAVHDVIHGTATSGTGLSDGDVAYLHKIVHRSQSGGKAYIPLPASQRQRARMMVILGEMDAGNDNPDLKSELAKLVQALIRSKNLSRGDAQLIRSTFL